MVGRTVFVALALAGLATVATAPAAAQDYDLGIAVGNTPPAVTLEDLDGKAVDFAQFVGKRPVVFEFWATWCPLCRALEPRFSAARAKYGDRVAFVAVAVGVNQNPASIKRHLQRHPIPFPIIAWDGKGAAVRAFDAPGTSYVVALDAAGKVTYTGAGEDQDINAAVASAVAGKTGDR